MGVKVNDTSREKTVATEIVSAYSTKYTPIIEDIIAIGRKTTKLVPVDAITAIVTSEVPSMAACLMGIPPFFRRTMFSITTMEFDIRAPMETAKLMSVIMFNVAFNCFNTMKLAMRDIGMEILTIITVRWSPMKRYRMAPVRIIPRMTFTKASSTALSV